MFVKLFFKDKRELLLNVECISSICTYNIKWQEDEQGKFIQVEDYNYELKMNNGDCFNITKEHYEQLCKILTSKL